MKQESTTLEGEVLVKGRAAEARVMTDPAPKEKGYILMVDKLATTDLDRIKRAVGVIVEYGCSCDHAALICRIRGVPVIRLQVAFSRLHDGQRICLDGTTGTIHLNRPFPDIPEWIPDLRESTWERLRTVQYQAAILDEDCVRTVNELDLYNARQFFLRAELLWLLRNECPFHSIRVRGVEGTADAIRELLLPIVERLEGDQTLNFRSLDAGSDEFHFMNDLARGRERNPQLGLRGIRHLLKRPELLQAELLALDEFRREGYDNVVFSLPFLTDPAHFDEVRRVASTVCTTELLIGVFVETPAAVYKIRAIPQRRPEFVCIGTKDLAQLILACDRTNPNVQHLYNLADGAVLKAASDVVAECASASVPSYVYTDIPNNETYLRNVPQLDSLSLTRGEFQTIAAGLRERQL